MNQRTRCLEVRRNDLRTTRIVEAALPELSPGQALLRIDRFGLTSNNVTYGVTGDVIGYWGFFPAAQGWGRVPAWGFAEVSQSRVDGLRMGARVYGFLPMADHVIVEPTRVSAHGFVDGAAHRAKLPSTYNRYQFTDSDPLYSSKTEGLQSVLVPLFVTSFFIDDFLADNDDFGAQRVIVSSASSKTAAGTALFLSRRQGHRPEVVGLTSPGNVGFVEGLGCYDQVLTYDNLEALDPSAATVYVDIAGSATVRSTIHHHLGDALRYSSAVGMAHWEDPPNKGELAGPKPTFFFAPSQVEKRLSEWGSAGYQQRLAAAWQELLEVAGNWVSIVDVPGLDNVPDVFGRLIDGAAQPRDAFVVDTRAQ